MLLTKYNPVSRETVTNPFIDISYVLHDAAELGNQTVMPPFTTCTPSPLSFDLIYLPTEKSCLGAKCIMPCMYNHITPWPRSFISQKPFLHSLKSNLSNSGRMYCNECQSWALRGILFLGLLRNMDYEWGRDQTCCGFNMYDSFHMHRPRFFISHSRWGSGSTSDTGEKQPHGFGFLSPVLG